MSKYLPDNPDLGEFIVVDEKPHPNGAKGRARFRPGGLSDAKSLRGAPFRPRHH
jgi:hypothetical protein